MRLSVESYMFGGVGQAFLSLVVLSTRIPGNFYPLKMCCLLGESSPIFQLCGNFIGSVIDGSLQLSSLYTVNKSCEQQSPISH